MNSRERVLTALRLGKPDIIPFMDLGVDHAVGSVIMGRPDYDPGELADTLELDALGYALYPPIYTVNQVADDGRSYIVGGRLKALTDLAMIDLPDPSSPGFLDGAKRFIDTYGGDRAMFAATNIGFDPLLLGMGLDGFSYALVDDPSVIDKILDIYTEWASVLAEQLPKAGFDFVWYTDDIAYKTGPMFSPTVFKQILLPSVRGVADTMSLPWVYHSDGDLRPILHDLLSLGMNGLHPFEPGAMDIEEAKTTIGDKVCLVGNVDVGELLANGTPDAVEARVKQLAETVGLGGGYILSSSNSIASFCKPENTIAMAKSVKRYGRYM